MLPAGYELQIAKLRMAELIRPSHRVPRSNQRMRRALAYGLRRLADRIEPHLRPGPALASRSHRSLP
jgi:hypothetical protein